MRGSSLKLGTVLRASPMRPRPSRSILTTILCLLGTVRIAQTHLGVEGQVEYVSPKPGFHASNSLVLVDVKIVVTDGGRAFLENCGELVGRPNEQTHGVTGCKLRLVQLDWSRGGSKMCGVQGVGGLEHASAEAMLVSLDEALCTVADNDSSLKCGIAVSVVFAESGIQVVIIIVIVVVIVTEVVEERIVRRKANFLLFRLHRSQVLSPSGPLEISLTNAAMLEEVAFTVETSAAARIAGDSCIGGDLGTRVGELTEAGVTTTSLMKAYTCIEPESS